MNSEKSYTQIKQLIEQETNQAGKSFTVGKFTGIGWLFIQHSPEEPASPLIAVKQYAKTVNIYVPIDENEPPLVEQYAQIFGKSNLGKTCIRISSLTPTRLDALKALVQKIKREAEQSA
ncbi:MULTISPECIES: hypothetical protein [Enterococcus]|uniref:DUF1801 domain-containing protein n=2 Tax=root TaxID=1 RepID=A0A179ERA6_ENTTH|nr:MULTISPECIES: hypothetical protein [Enterococcus]MDA3965752.1 hypothetical protein [Enterococcus thailandicus]MDK4351862.1 hypothetical protein [Enterococcus thailandicus]MDT2733989.1 hypothetical protein [Enterococcus thailandicus]MDT2751561.1 hypothetical protein [Enterococcus thailandicus]MDT2776331.1 hypothetical protein [Enterococcus thailandicus]